MELNFNDIWLSFLERMQKVFQPVSFHMWFDETKINEITDEKITLIVPMSLHKRMFMSTYYDLISDAFAEITGYQREVDCLLEDEIVNIDDKVNDFINNYNENSNVINQYVEDFESNLNKNLHFDNFVVGDTNKFAKTAALAVAQNPGVQYNPLFIYGKSGLGKTHLMHAIGNYIVTHSDKRVLYVSAEQFKNDFTSIAVNSGKGSNLEYLEAFRDKYRNVDVLIIDDIQFLDNAIKTQQEFNNTFNALHDNHKQIIMASDKSINDYKMLEERLKTRFKWGLTESIMSPEFELKKNIIKNKIMINDFDLNLSEDVINFIANNCGNDIRNLEGSVIRLLSYKACLNIDEITLDIAKEALTEFTTETVYRVNSVSKIIDIVAKYFNLEVPVIKGKMRKKNIADARAIAMYLSRIMTDESLERIGLEFGGRDHTTVIHSFEKINKEINNNPKLAEEIKLLKEKICE